MLTFYEWLVENVDIDAMDNFGSTPLHDAIRAHSPEMVVALIKNGADVNKETSHYMSPLEISRTITDLSKKRIIRAEMHDKSGDKHKKIIEAQNKIQDILIKHGAKDSREITEAIDNINNKSPSGNNPLHYAVRNKNLEMVQALVKSGADINSVDAWDRTPLEYAAKFGLPHIVRHLINSGANIHRKNDFDLSISDWAHKPITKANGFRASQIKAAAMIRHRAAELAGEKPEPFHRHWTDL